MRTPPVKGPPPIHLYRGAPAVRSWSKHQETVTDWTLCGIRGHKGSPLRATEAASAVTCRYCLCLLRPDAKATPRCGKGDAT